MKTYKVFLRDYQTESVSAENFAVDDHNNLIVGNAMFHAGTWTRIAFLHDDGPGNPYYGETSASGYAGPVSQSLTVNPDYNY